MLKDHKVYITDWKNARTVPLTEGAFHLDDYVNYVQEFIRHLQKTYGNCHVISVCQPTVPVLAAVSLMASRGETTPLTMTMMGGPIDARKSPTAVNNLAMNKSFSWFENNVIYRVPSNFPGAGRRVYPGFLQHTGFVAMNPDRHATSHYDYFKDLIKGDDASAEAHRKFYDEYNAVLDMDADYYLETIRVVFQEFRLVNGTWDVRNPKGVSELVRPQDIRTTAFTSPSKANWTTSRARAKPKPPMACAPACPLAIRSTWKSRAPGTTASSAAAAGVTWCTRRSRPSSWTTRKSSKPLQPPWHLRLLQKPHPKRQRKPVPPSGDSSGRRAHPRGPAADAVHPLRLPGLPCLCPGHCAGRRGHQPLPPGWR
jgi:hypothetical protein